MSLVINNNLMAANTATNLTSHYGRLATSIQRLSSGLRVNSAADDAAGLAIRELMRVDIAALNQGVRNANDAISMLQVADGALAIIDEKLIRMKELAEQAATGTYDSTQRMMIDSEFQAMGTEIDRIANATDFNGIKLLDGSLSGAHNGKGMKSTGKMKIHFGSGNDSAEDYYYVDIGDCSTKGLNLRNPGAGSVQTGTTVNTPTGGQAQGQLQQDPNFPFNNWTSNSSQNSANNADPPLYMEDVFKQEGTWYISAGTDSDNFIFKIKAGTKNIIINMAGCVSGTGDNDIQLFTSSGVHLAGTPQNDFVFTFQGGRDAAIDKFQGKLGFDHTQYDGSLLNSGPDDYDGVTLKYTSYNGMNIGYSGDSDIGDNPANDGNIPRDRPDFELLTIDVATEDLVVWFPGQAPSLFQTYKNVPDSVFGPPLQGTTGSGALPANGQGSLITINTQEKAQKALVRISDAIVQKDKIRAHIGALQNRLENTVANLTIQAENLQAAESRISDANVAIEMTNFVRNQILTQSAMAMLSQANSMPQMAMRLIGG